MNTKEQWDSFMSAIDADDRRRAAIADIVDAARGVVEARDDRSPIMIATRTRLLGVAIDKLAAAIAELDQVRP